MARPGPQTILVEAEGKPKSSDPVFEYFKNFKAKAKAQFRKDINPPRQNIQKKKI